MWIDYLIMSYKEMMEEYFELLKKWKKLPVGSEERLMVEIEMADIGDWTPIERQQEYIGY